MGYVLYDLRLRTVICSYLLVVTSIQFLLSLLLCSNLGNVTEGAFLTARSGSRKGKGEGGEVGEDEGTRV